MAYWIQETGGDSQRSDWRMYHCDYRTDIANLPLNDRDGVQQGSDTLRNEPNDWKRLGV